MSQSRVAVSGLRRTFGPITALDGVDLALDDAEIVGIAGPNGSGKTTLIRCLLGLLTPTEGQITVSGHDPQSYPADFRGRLGYMPQHEAVYRDLTVRENVAFFANLYGVPDPTSAVDRALSFVELEHRAGSRVEELSGGMIRRTSLACAFVHDPDILFLDEPTVGVDPQLRSEMWSAFRERRDAGTLTLVSTHYLGEARRCDRVLFLREGGVLAFEPPDDLIERTGTDGLEAAFLDLLQADSSQLQDVAASMESDQ